MEDGTIKRKQVSQIPFSWKKAVDRQLEKTLHRAIHLARTNPDYKTLHPNECRDNPSNKILPHCHKEAEIRILKEHASRVKSNTVPAVERPARVNRIG